VCWVFRFGCALPGTPAQHGLEAGREIRQVVIAVAPARVDDLRKVFCEASQDGLLANQGTLSESIFLGRAIDWPKFHAIPLGVGGGTLFGVTNEGGVQGGSAARSVPVSKQTIARPAWRLTESRVLSSADWVNNAAFFYPAPG
jgi:hypothetical protein